MIADTIRWVSSAGASVRGGTDVAIPAAEEEQPPAWTSPSGLVLITSLLVGGFALLSSALVLASPLTNSTEWTLFVLTLAVLTPVAIAGGRRLAQRVVAAAGRAGLAELAALAAVGIIAIVLAARSSYALEHRSSTVLLAFGLVWVAVIAWAARRLTRGRRLVPAGLADADSPRTWYAVAALAAVGLIAFFPGHFFHADQVAVSLVLAAALLFLHLRRLAVPRWAGLLLDVAVVVFVVMIVTDLSGYQEYLRADAVTYVAGDDNPIPPHDLAVLHRHHEDFFLGPLNDMLHGRPLLVDTSSQYGAGIFYFLAAFFQIAPLGYGALGLIASFLTGLQFALAYGVLRLVGVARTIAIPAVVAAVLGLVLGSLGSYNDFPSNGGLRFGVPWLIIAAAVMAARAPDRRRALWRGVTIALVACTAIWSFETFAYAGAVVTAIVAFEAATGAPGRRLRAFVRSLATVLAACVLAHVLFAIATRVFAGAWPDWSTYLAYLNVYSAQSELLGTTVPWTPALPMLLVHLLSLLGLAALVARGHELVRERRPALVAIAATNGLGVASFSYWVGLSLQNALFLLGLPVVAVVALWLSLAGDARARVPNAFKVAALALGLWLGATLAISGWQDTQDKWRRTALAHAIPGAGDDASLPDALSRLWHNPPSDPRAVPAQRLLHRHFRPGERALVMMEPDLTVETLVRSDRINVLPISQPIQDNLVPDHVDPKVIATVDALKPGTLMLTQPSTWNAPLKASPVNVANGLVRVQRLALERIRSRFELQIIDRGPDGLAVVRLVAK